MPNHPMQQSSDERAPAELQEIATNVTIGRARAGLSQAALAAKAELSRSAISDIERAASPDPSFRTLLRIANALGISVGALFVPTTRGVVDDDELARRAAVDDDEFIDARALHAAIAERDERYSKAGRPRTAAR